VRRSKPSRIACLRFCSNVAQPLSDIKVHDSYLKRCGSLSFPAHLVLASHPSRHSQSQSVRGVERMQTSWERIQSWFLSSSAVL